MNDNTFSNTVEALFKGMNGFISTKTVVGDAIKVDSETTILPLIDVSFGIGAGAFATTDWNSISSEFEIRYHPFEDDVINEDETLKEGCHPELVELVTWVNQASDEEFKAHFEEHFNKEYMIKYFLAVYTFGMVDNFGFWLKYKTFSD